MKPNLRTVADCNLSNNLCLRVWIIQIKDVLIVIYILQPIKAQYDKQLSEMLVLCQYSLHPGFDTVSTMSTCAKLVFQSAMHETSNGDAKTVTKEGTEASMKFPGATPHSDLLVVEVSLDPLHCKSEPSRTTS
jgi:hypothetical protein